MSPYFVCQKRTLLHKNAGQVGFVAGKVDFQVTCPSGRVAVGTIFEAWVKSIPCMFY